MGISNDQWRAKIGLFCQKVSICHSLRESTGCSRLLACIIATMLLISGVELNPGPTVAELAKRLDEFVASYDVMRDHLMQISESTIPALSASIVKANEAFNELSTLLNSTKEAIKQHDLRLCSLEISVSEMRSSIPSAVADEHNRLVRANATVLRPALGGDNYDISNRESIFSIEHVVKNALDKEKRKCNVIIFNLHDTNSFIDDKNNLSELMYDLGVQEDMIQSIERIGRQSAKDRPLRIKLNSEWSRDILLDAAYQLKMMKRKWPKVGISPDRTFEEMSAHRTLIQEYRQRLNHGEQIRLIGNKITSINSNQPSDQGSVRQKSTTAISTSVPTVTAPSPLRVHLPPISPCPASSLSSLSATASVFCSNQTDLLTKIVNVPTASQQGN